jgi:hypothetical protein
MKPKIDDYPKPKRGIHDPQERSAHNASVCVSSNKNYNPNKAAYMQIYLYMHRHFAELLSDDGSLMDFYALFMQKMR